MKGPENVLNFGGANRGNGGQFLDPQVALSGLSHSDKQVVTLVKANKFFANDFVQTRSPRRSRAETIMHRNQIDFSVGSKRDKL